MPPTIRDIAKALNLSVSTVSYALNNGPRPVPAHVRDKVLETAKQLNYRPNRLAKSMITGRTHTIGIVPSDQAVNLLISPFVLSCMNGIVNESERRRNDVLMFTRFPADHHEDIANTLLDGRVDGLIFVAPFDDSKLVKIVQNANLPFIVTNAIFDGAASLTVENAQGVKTGLEYLVQLGHHKIGMITGKPEMRDSREREIAFREFMSAKGLEIREDWIQRGYFVPDQGELAAGRILDLTDRPTAIFSANDEMAVGTIRAAQARGIRVPEELSVIGFDNSIIGSLMTPGITTLRQPAEEIGEAAVRTLLDWIDHGLNPTSKTFSTELIVRASTSRPMEHPKQ